MKHGPTVNALDVATFFGVWITSCLICDVSEASALWTLPMLLSWLALREFFIAQEKP